MRGFEGGEGDDDDDDGSCEGVRAWLRRKWRVGRSLGLEQEIEMESRSRRPNIRDLMGLVLRSRSLRQSMMAVFALRFGSKVFLEVTESGSPYTELGIGICKEIANSLIARDSKRRFSPLLVRTVPTAEFR